MKRNQSRWRTLTLKAETILGSVAPSYSVKDSTRRQTLMHNNPESKDNELQHQAKAKTLHCKEFRTEYASWRNPKEPTLTNVQTTNCWFQQIPHNAVNEPTRSLTSKTTASRQCKLRSGQGSFCRAAEGLKAVEE